MSLNDGKKILRAKRVKRIGIIVASVSAGAIAVILLGTLLRGGTNTDGYVIKLDNAEKANHFTMSSDEGGKASTILNGEPVNGIYPTSANTIESYIDSLSSETTGGSRNMVHPSREGYYAAVVYTLYLNNTSVDEEQKLAYEVHLDNYVGPTNGARGPLDYARIAIFTSIVGDSASENVTYFGAASNREGLGNELGNDNTREAITGREQGDDGSGHTIRKSSYSGKSSDKYCINFKTGEQSDLLVQEELTIPQGKSMKFTFVHYWEGTDFDCGSYEPDTSTILMSLHFGVL